MTETVTVHVHKDDYQDPRIGDYYHDEHLGLVELVTVVAAEDGFDLTYRTAGTSTPGSRDNGSAARA